MQLGQILGQFASATPMALVVWLKVLEKAYDEIDISSEDWKKITNSIEAKQQQSQPPSPGPTGPAPTPPNASPQGALLSPQSPQQQPAPSPQQQTS
jgi:hypothetical protein